MLIEVDLFVLIDVFDADGPESVELQEENNQIFTSEKDRRVRVNSEVNDGDETNDQKG